MTVKEITAEWLKAHGYDGLCNDNECGCFVGDLMPCGDPGEHCEAGHKVRCDYDGEECNGIAPGRKEGAPCQSRRGHGGSQ